MELIRFYFISFFKYIVQCHWFYIMVLGSLERENEMHYYIFQNGFSIVFSFYQIPAAKWPLQNNNHF